MFNLEQWKRDWTENANEAAANTSADSGWSAATANRCRNAERLLLLDLAQALARVDIACDRAQLEQLQQAARMVGT